MNRIHNPKTGLRVLVILILSAVWLTVFLPSAGAADEGPSLRVRSSYSVYGLRDDMLLVDLYYVASPVDGGYLLTEPFGNRIITWSSNRELADLSQSVATIAFEKAKPVVSGQTGGSVIDSDDAGNPLREGLYLLVVRGANMADYVSRERINGEISYVTYARTEDYLFRFLPTLIILKADEDRLEIEPKADPIPIEPTPDTPDLPPDVPPVVPPDVPIEPDEPIDIPDENVPPEELPITGQLWWPVPVLFVLGAVMITSGLVLRRKDHSR